MAKFKVLRPIELAGKLYVPEGASAPSRSKSCSNGQDLDVDTTGAIELSDQQAAEMRDGQIQEISNQQSALSDQRSAVGAQKQEGLSADR
jgi:hypothetical protein